MLEVSFVADLNDTYMQTPIAAARSGIPTPTVTPMTMRLMFLPFLSFTDADVGVGCTGTPEVLSNNIAFVPNAIVFTVVFCVATGKLASTPSETAVVR